MKVALYGQYFQDNTFEIISTIVPFFEKHHIELVVEANYVEILKSNQINIQNSATFSSYTDIDASFEMLISIGGDGTILRAATYVRDTGVPILGINAGRLGFLATVQLENIVDFLTIVINKKHKLSKRNLLSLRCIPENESLKEINFAMNEVSVSRKDTTSMITIETFLDGEYLNSYWADGLIISTPTGSTGYSLSCGGPILTPEVNALVITPIAPHNLNARPLVIPNTTEIKLKVSGREDNYLVSLDSRITAVGKDSELFITKTPFQINMIEIPDETFLKTLREKLLWGQDKRN
jgi:NAD+ kinase